MADQNPPSTPPGWYPDGSGGQRYWDGTQWTGNSSPASPPAPTHAGDGDKWWHNPVVVGLLLLCCSPIGLLLTWLNPKWSTKTKAIITAVLVVLVAIGAASGAFEDVSTTSPSLAPAEDESDEPTEEEPDEKSDEPAERTQAAKIGEDVELKGTRYTVESATLSDTIGPSGFGEDADGRFIVIELTIENKKNESKTFLDSAAKIIGGNGKKYSADTDAGIMADKPLIFEQMDPDNPKTGTIVFDLPPDAVAGSKLELSDLFGRGSVLVDLGLS